jgi:hypothetical protein
MPRARHLLSSFVPLLLAAAGQAGAAAFQVGSTSFTDGGPISKAQVASGAECGKGQALSPQVSWSNPPAGTRSVAVFLYDPDGARGLGVAHWVVYNVDVARHELKQGEAQQSLEGVSVGLSIAGTAAYRGLCPPAGDKPHHYALTVVATDLPPGQLPEGLGRDALLKALKSHALAGQSVVGTFGQ